MQEKKDECVHFFIQKDLPFTLPDVNHPIPPTSEISEQQHYDQLVYRPRVLALQMLITRSIHTEFRAAAPLCSSGRPERRRRETPGTGQHHDMCV